MQAANFQLGGQVNAAPPNFNAGANNGQRDSKAIRAHILSTLRSQQPPAGWQTVFRLDARLSAISQILQQLFLLKPGIPDEKALHVAITFEAAKFHESPNEDAYRQACHQKLQDITNTRQNQAMQNQMRLSQGIAPGAQTSMQQQMMQPNMMNQNQMNPAFMNNPMAQQQMRQATGQLTQQQQQQLYARQHQQQQQRLAMQNLQNNSQGQMQNQQPGSMDGIPGTQGLSAAESAWVRQKMEQLARNLTQSQRNDLAQKAANFPEHAKQQLHAKNTTPINWLITNEALKLLREAKQNPAFNPAMPAQNAPQSNLQARQPQPGQNTTSANGNNNMAQIMIRQQEALRLEQQGQTVVPRSQGGMQGLPTNQQFMHTRQNEGFQPQQGVFQQHNQSLWNQQHPMNQKPAQNGTPQSQQNTNLVGQRPPQASNTGMNQGGNTPLPSINKPMNPPGQNQAPPAQAPGQMNLSQV